VPNRNANYDLWALSVLTWLLAEKMEKVLSDQDVLNTFVSGMNAAIAAVAAEITALKNQIAANPPPVAIDFTAADTALAALMALEPPAPEPAPPAPAGS
jgi:hypothetical protein